MECEGCGQDCGCHSRERVMVLYKCPKCGAMATHSVLAVIPPRDRFECTKCDYTYTSDPKPVVEITAPK
jgi:ribosomal protein S27AE